MDNLLYYPYINLPESDWTARALLYYDSVGSIVPRQYRHSSSNLYEPFMHEALVNGLVRAIDPMVELRNPYEVYEIFMNYVHSENFELDKRRRSFVRPNISRGRKLQSNNLCLKGYRMHVDKFEHNLYPELAELRLATRLDHSWYIVETNTANELMTLLASVIGSNINYQPTTDELADELKGLIETDNIVTINNQSQAKRDRIISELIPFPQLIDFKKICDFKEKHHDSLRAFRNRVESIALDPALDPGTPLFNNRVEELVLQKDELSRRMSESKLGQIVFGTFCGTLAAGITVATADTAAGALLGVPGFINAIYNAIQIQRPENIVDQTGLKFVALMDKKIRKPAYFSIAGKNKTGGLM